MIFDTHAHYYDDAFDADREALLSSLPERGVALVVCPGCDLESSRQSIALSERYPFLYAAAGYHPENLEGVSLAHVDQIRALCGHEKVVAVGECGLDYHWPVPKDAQLALFEAEIRLALELDKPIIVHDRQAHVDVYALLKKYRPKGVLHCYSGSAEDAVWLAEQGMCLGFGGAATFKGAKRAAKAIEALPLEAILLETDCPYMAPEPVRGRRCDSSMIQYVGQYIAQRKQLPAEQVFAQTAANARRVFGLE